MTSASSHLGQFMSGRSLFCGQQKRRTGQKKIKKKADYEQTDRRAKCRERERHEAMSINCHRWANEIITWKAWYRLAYVQHHIDDHTWIWWDMILARERRRKREFKWYGWSTLRPNRLSWA